MKCFFTFAIAAALVVGVSATSWSQGASSSGTSGSGGAGAAGTAGNAGTAGAVGTAGTAGNVGTAGTAGNVGTSGTAGAVGTGAPGATNRAGAAGTAGIGPDGTPGLGRGRVGANGRANANAGLNNAAARANLNSQFDLVRPTPFFSDPGARQQLNLNNTQFNALNRAHQNAFARFNQAASNLNPNLTPEQRALQLQQLQAQFNQDMSGTVNSTLTNPQTLSRFNQLNRQFMGFNAFNDPTVRQQLNLTPDQVRQLRTLSNNWRQQLQQFRRGAGNDLSSVDTAQWNQLWQQFGTQLNGVLTPEQQQIWAQQTGQPLTFSPNVVLGEPQLPFDQENRPVVDPTVPRFFPNAANREGTQPQSGTRQATNPGSSAPSGTTPQGAQGGTVR